MKTIINLQNDTIVSELSLNLIPFGITPYEIDENNLILDILKSKKDIIILITDNKDISFLQSAKEILPEINIFLIINEKTNPKDLIELSKAGIKSFIPYNNIAQKLAEDIKNEIINKRIQSKDLRQHYRVKPDRSEESSATIYLKEYNLYMTGDILDISAGGIAVKFDDFFMMDYIQINNVYEDLTIILNGKQIKCGVYAVSKKEQYVGFKFNNIEPDNMRILSMYIRDKIQSEIRKLKNINNI